MEALGVSVDLYRIQVHQGSDERGLVLLVICHIASQFRHYATTEPFDLSESMRLVIVSCYCFDARLLVECDKEFGSKFGRIIGQYWRRYSKSGEKILREKSGNTCLLHLCRQNSFSLLPVWADYYNNVLFSAIGLQQRAQYVNLHRVERAGWRNSK